MFQRLVKPKSLTHCSLDNSTAGRFRERIWRSVLNFGRSAPGGAVCQAETVETFRREGILHGLAPSFLSEAGKVALTQVDAEVRALLSSPENQAILAEGVNKDLGKSYLIHLIEFTTPQPADSAILRLALDPNILQVITGYMGIKPVLHAVGSWYNFPTHQDASHSQLWHRDPEDVKIVKVFIYLDPVGPENGPFAYLPRTHPMAEYSDISPEHTHLRRITDAEMEKSFERQHWIECTGPAHSMIMAETVGFHRGGYVREGHRMLVSFTYTSAKPQKPRWLRIKGTPPADFNDLQLAALRG